MDCIQINDLCGECPLRDEVGFAGVVNGDGEVPSREEVVQAAETCTEPIPAAGVLGKFGVERCAQRLYPLHTEKSYATSMPV